MNDERLHWLALNTVKGIGAVRFKALMETFGSAQKAWDAKPEELYRLGIGEVAVNNLIAARRERVLSQIPADLERYQVQALTWEDETYPRRLRELDQAPPVLYVRGEPLPEDEWAVGVVGTRKVTEYGQQVAEELATFLAQNSVVVVSGLAQGVDGIAHKAALDAGGRTIAVLGHGLDRIYPAVHRPLAERIIGQGVLVSDYSIGTPPESANFPPRNRIISGLSLAVVIVEAGEESGALITAGFAAEQGREVFAVPGKIYSPQSKGSNRLIQQGAHPLVNFEDLLDALNLQMMGQQKVARAALPTDPTEAKLFDLLSHEPLHVNEIGAKSSLPIDQVSSTLALMELKGLVKQVGVMSYVVARELRAEYTVDNG
ncbi:MAG: DNA-processing protein DprA [Anaerolineales bacterium]